MIIYVDIDNTICTTIGTNYESATPIPKRIEHINKLYEEGHTIIYWTARGSGTPNDITRINNIKELTFNQLRSWNCYYTKLSVAEKPIYDLLIDDKALSDNHYFIGT